MIEITEEEYELIKSGVLENKTPMDIAYNLPVQALINAIAMKHGERVGSSYSPESGEHITQYRGKIETDKGKFAFTYNQRD